MMTDDDAPVTPGEFMAMSRTLRNAARLRAVLEDVIKALDRGGLDESHLRRLKEEQPYWPETAGCEGEA